MKRGVVTHVHRRRPRHCPVLRGVEVSKETLPLGLLSKPTRYLFFTGKGGVGKTSLSCA